MLLTITCEIYYNITILVLEKFSVLYLIFKKITILNFSSHPRGWSLDAVGMPLLYGELNDTLISGKLISTEMIYLI